MRQVLRLFRGQHHVAEQLLGAKLPEIGTTSFDGLKNADFRKVISKVISSGDFHGEKW